MANHHRYCDWINGGQYNLHHTNADLDTTQRSFRTQVCHFCKLHGYNEHGKSSTNNIFEYLVFLKI